MNKTFITDVYINNSLWKIYILNEKDSYEYYNLSNKKNLNEDNLNLCKSEIINCNFINLSNKISYSNIDNSPSFLDIYDRKFYNVYNTFINYQKNEASIIFYYCNIEDPFIIIQLTPYMEFTFMLYINKKEIIKMPISECYNLDHYFPRIIHHLNFVNNEIFHPITLFKKYLFFGFVDHIGHHLWNEVSGLYNFLKNQKYHDKIDGIILGSYDPFNVKKYLKNNFNFKLIKFNDLFGPLKNNSNINLTNIYPVVLNHFYIDKNVKNMFEPIIQKNNNKKNNILELSIDLRVHNRYLINQDIFYTKLLKKILNNFSNYKIKINLLGCFQTIMYNINKNKNQEYIKQNIIANKIIKNFKKKSNIKFLNLIGESFFNIKKNTIKSKLFIACFGTTFSNLNNWIYNSKIMVFGPKKAYDWTPIQFDVLKNFNAIIFPKKYIISKKDIHGLFNVKFDLFYKFFRSKFINIFNIKKIQKIKFKKKIQKIKFKKKIQKIKFKKKIQKKISKKKFKKSNSKNKFKK